MISLRTIISSASLQPSYAVLFPLLLSSAAIGGPELLLKPAPSAMVSLEWSDPSERWLLETSRDLREWGLLDSRNLERPAAGSFRFSYPADGRQGFFRLREAGSPKIHVIGDSISVAGTWTNVLATSSGRHVFTQAIAGTASPTMVNRARGVELQYPQTGAYVAPGVVRMNWVRHVADRTQWEPFRGWWKSCPKTVSEPHRIEVFEGGKFRGLAKHDTRGFTTDHVNFPRRITCPGHGFQAGDRVTFISNDPNYPSQLSVLDGAARWDFSSPLLPPRIIERRVYWTANVLPDSFEVKELSSSSETLDLGGDAQGSPSVEKGWYFDFQHAGGAWPLTWKSRTPYDESVWVLEASANDFPLYSATGITVPSTLRLLEQMTEINPRFVILCPPSGSNADRGPGSFNWNNCYVDYLPWVRQNYPDHHLDLMALMDTQRTAKELGMLADPLVPELLWIRGNPALESSWEASAQALPGSSQMWVGPGYIPLQFRMGFSDGIHLSSAGNHFVAGLVNAFITSKGW
jgi:hypothetical protein